MKHVSDVVIVGGGVIGLTAAHYLAKDGARVAVLDKGEPGREASWAGAGILPPCDLAHANTAIERLRGLSNQLFPTLSEELFNLTHIDNEYWVCGGLEVEGQTHTGEQHTPAATDEWCGPGGLNHWLSEAGARRLEPGLSPGLHARHIPQMAQIRNPRHLEALVAACRQRGVRILAGAEVQGVARSENHLRAVVTAQGEVVAERFLLSAGAWTTSLLERIGWRAGIRPVRGQIALLRPDSPLLRHIILCGSKYLVPRRDGRILVGSTEEDVGFNKRTTAEAISQLLSLAVALVPRLAKAEVEHTWAGLRPGSPDGMPFIGPVPGWDNLWVGAGHFRAGLQLSTGTGLLLKEMLLGQKLSLNAAAFGLNRTHEVAVLHG